MTDLPTSCDEHQMATGEDRRISGSRRLRMDKLGADVLRDSQSMLCSLSISYADLGLTNDRRITALHYAVFIPRSYLEKINIPDGDLHDGVTRDEIVNLPLLSTDLGWASEGYRGPDPSP